MALQKLQIPISFNGGIDTKTDDKQIMATKLLELENGVFTKKGAINKRYGYDILSQVILDSEDTISSGYGISAFKNELNIFNGTKLYTYIDSTESWKERGTIASVEIFNKSILKNIYQQTNVDFAYNQGVGVYVWDDSSGGARYSVIDESSNSILASNQLLSLAGEKPRVVGIGNFFLIFYIQGNTIQHRYITASAPGTISSPEEISNTVHATNKVWDVQKLDTRAYISYNTNANSVSLSYMTDLRVLSAEVFIAGDNCSGAVGTATDSSNNTWLFWHNGTAFKYAIWNQDLTSVVLASTVLETIADVRNLTAIETSPLVCTVLYEIDNGAADNFVKKTTGTSAGVIGTPEVFVRSVGLASKFFTYNSQFYVTLTHDSTLQSTYFVYSLDDDIVTKINYSNAGGLTAASILSSVYETETGSFIIPNLKKGDLQTEDGTVFTSLGINSTLLNFESLNNFITTELGNNMQIVGGLIQSYDGVTVNEAGFNVFPEGVTSALVSPGTGNLPNGEYQYSIVYAWVDNSGQIHRSAPSIPNIVAVSGGPSNVELTIPTLRITKKENVFIEVYRTEVNGTLFYKVTSNTALTLNDPMVDSIVYVDTKTDAQLISGEILYTTGGVLDNIGPPPSSIITSWKSRVVLKSSDEDNVIWYSKIRQEGFPVEFSDALRITVDPKGGDITALGVLDDKLVIFKKSSIHIQAGDGPNNLGEQSDFGLPQFVSGDAGCSDANSVIETPLGLMFKSKKGIYLLDRGLAVQYLGAPAEAFNEARITSAKMVSDSNQIRFTTEDSLCLVYDYFFNQWSTFTNHESLGATIHNEVYHFIKSDGRVYKENSSVFTDGDQSIKMRLISAWMNTAELQGFQRFYKLLILGTYKSKHRLNIKFGYDFSPNFSEDAELDPFTIIGQTAYGDDSPYGSGSPYGGANPLYHWRAFPTRQKCTSFRISLEDVLDNVFGESFSISNFRMEIGIKQGSNKIASTSSVGSS